MCGPALGQYHLHTDHDVYPVYRQAGTYPFYLYKTDSAWYCGSTVGREDSNECWMRNMNITNDNIPSDHWEYHKYLKWVPAPTLTMTTGPLPQCSVTIQGGVADGKYEGDGEYKYGRQVFRRTVAPCYRLYVGGACGWCVYDDDGEMVMWSNIVSMCPSVDSDGVGRDSKWRCCDGNGWYSDSRLVTVECSVHM